MIDPLGLERCAQCTNAFAYDADEAATARWRAAGHTGFVCYRCAGSERPSPDAARWTPAELPPNV